MSPADERKERRSSLMREAERMAVENAALKADNEALRRQVSAPPTSIRDPKTAAIRHDAEAALRNMVANQAEVARLGEELNRWRSAAIALAALLGEDQPEASK